MYELTFVVKAAMQIKFVLRVAWNIENQFVLSVLKHVGILVLSLTFRGTQGQTLMCQAPSTLIRFQAKAQLFCSRYGYCPHYNAENDHRKMSHAKTLSRVERFENAVFQCFLVWTVKTMLSENGDVIKIDTTRRQTTRPSVSKMADRRYHVASISRQFRGPIY